MNSNTFSISLQILNAVRTQSATHSVVSSIHCSYFPEALVTGFFYFFISLSKNVYSTAVISSTVNTSEMRGEERGCIEKGSYITVTSVTTVTKFFIFSLSIGDCKWFKYALSHKWSVYNSLPKKLVLYKHKLLGSAATWVPNSLPAHVQTGPSSVSCALLSLETKESYHRPVQEQDWLLWNPQEGLGLLQGRSWFLPLTRRDRAMVLQRDKPCFPAYTPKLQEVSCLSQPPSVQGHIFLHYNTKDFNIKWSFAEKKKSTLMMFSRISFSYIY